MIVDLFGGPGGWSEGLRLLGLRDVGVETSSDACATRYAAGHATWQQDVEAVSDEQFAALRPHDPVVSPGLPGPGFALLAVSTDRRRRASADGGRAPRLAPRVGPRSPAVDFGARVATGKARRRVNVPGRDQHPKGRC